MVINGVTPVAIVDAIEPSLEFWEQRLGFERVAGVEHEGALGFVILRREGAEVMLQSRASVEDDLGVLTGAPRQSTCVLYFDVSDLEPIIEALSGMEVAVGTRTTFYGAREIYYREPGGHLVGFAAREAESEKT